MAIIYSYPAESSPQPGDLILGTSTATVDGKQTNVTRTYTMQVITDYIKSLGGVGVESITFSAPLTGGTITLSGTVGIPKSDATTDGYLSSTDWSIFNNKIGGISGSTDSLPVFTSAVTLGNSSIAEPSGGTTVTVGKTLAPLADATHDLGVTGTARWRNMFLSGTANAVDFSGTNLTITGTLSTNGSTGTNGYILQSKGAAAPQWVDLSSAYDTYDVNVTTQGSDVDFNLTSTSGTDNSKVQITAGSGIGLTANSSGQMTIDVIAPFTGSVTDVTSTNTNILTVANSTTTPALSPVMGSVASANTGLVTGGDVNTAIQSALTGLVEFKGGFDGSTGKVAGTADFLDSRGTQIAAAVGDYYVVTVAGTFYTETVEIGDSLICQTATTSGTGSLSDWVTVQSNIGVATTTTTGIASFPTGNDGLDITAGGAVTAQVFSAGNLTGGYVPDASSLSGDEFLSRDGTFKAGPVTNVSSVATGNGLIGGPITSTGTISPDYTSGNNIILSAADGTLDTLADDDDILFSVGNNVKYGNLSQLKTYIGAGSGTVTGSGTLNTIPKFTPSGTAIGDSNIADTGSLVTITGDAKVTGTLEFAATSDLLTPNTTPTAGNAGDVLKSLGAGNGWEWGTVTAGVSSVTFTQGGTIAAATNLNESLEITPTTGAVVIKAKKFAGVDTAGVVTSTTGDASNFLRGDGNWAAAGGLPTKTVMNFTGDGSDKGATGTFTLSPTPLSTAYTDVYISGVYQQKNSYSLAGGSSNELLFATAPPITASNGIEVVITT